MIAPIAPPPAVRVAVSLPRLADLLRLGDASYDPSLHYQQIRDLWGGTTTPDAGR